MREHNMIFSPGDHSSRVLRTKNQYCVHLFKAPSSCFYQKQDQPAFITLGDTSWHQKNYPINSSTRYNKARKMLIKHIGSASVSLGRTQMAKASIFSSIVSLLMAN